MNHDDALGLRDWIRNTYIQSIVGSSSDDWVASAKGVWKPGNRMAVGYSLTDGAPGERNLSYRLEIRVARLNGRAARFAAKVVDREGPSVNVEVVPTVDMPSRRAARTENDGLDQTPAIHWRKRPLHIGLSIGTGARGPGTLGAFVSTSEREAVLSASHVLGPNIGLDVFQPGPESGVGTLGHNIIGQLNSRSKPTTIGSNQLDCAVALLADVSHVGNQFPNIETIPDRLVGKRISTAADIEDLGPRPTVAKLGRTTGYTEGTVTAIDMMDISVNVPEVGICRFDNVIEIEWDPAQRPFTLPGDSGSMVFSPETMAGVGLHFAGGRIIRNGREVGVSYSCSLPVVLKSMNARLLD